MKKLLACTAAVLALGNASCSRTNLHAVSGKVVYHGRPAAGATVYFHRTDHSAKDSPILGIVQEDGSFELVSGSLGKGALPGEYDVLVEWKRGLSTSSCGCGTEAKGRAQVGPDRLKGRYADRKRPLLHATVEARTTSLPPFELTDGPTVKR